jgi:hypothetical protein
MYVMSANIVGSNYEEEQRIAVINDSERSACVYIAVSHLCQQDFIAKLQLAVFLTAYCCSINFAILTLSCRHQMPGESCRRPEVK